MKEKSTFPVFHSEFTNILPTCQLSAQNNFGSES